MARRLLAALLLPLALTSCGNDEPEAGSKEDPSRAPADASPGGDDESAIEDTILEFLVTGDCDLATDGYLQDLSLFSDENSTREENCAAWEKAFVEPLYTKEDVVLTDLVVDDGVATVEVGSEIAPDITVQYQLSLVDGDWLVSGDEINSDDI